MRNTEGANVESGPSRGLLAYYGVAPEQAYWSALWAREALQRLLAVARRDPLCGTICPARAWC
jgi:hypothetical protein